MKKAIIATGLLLILAVAPGSNIFCQQGKGSGQMERAIHSGSHMNYRLLDLTEDQKAKMTEIRLGHSELVKPLNTDLQKVRIDYRSLITEAEIDLDAINENIDKQTDLQNKIMKSNILFRKQMKDVLTVEQKQMLKARGFDVNNRSYRHGKAHNSARGNRQGFHGGIGKGYGRGFNSRDGRGSR